MFSAEQILFLAFILLLTIFLTGIRQFGHAFVLIHDWFELCFSSRNLEYIRTRFFTPRYTYPCYNYRRYPPRRACYNNTPLSSRLVRKTPDSSPDTQDPPSKKTCIEEDTTKSTAPQSSPEVSNTAKLPSTPEAPNTARSSSPSPPSKDPQAIVLETPVPSSPSDLDILQKERDFRSRSPRTRHPAETQHQRHLTDPNYSDKNSERPCSPFRTVNLHILRCHKYDHANCDVCLSKTVLDWQAANASLPAFELRRPSSKKNINLTRHQAETVEFALRSNTSPSALAVVSRIHNQLTHP